MSIVLSNGHILEYLAASGALGYDGRGWPWEWIFKLIGKFDSTLFTSIGKTITLEKRKGNFHWYNPFYCVRPIEGGVVNAYDLSNGGLEWFCRDVAPNVDSKKQALMASLLGKPHELVQMVERLEQFDFVGYEINISCPNTGDDLLTNTRQNIRGCELVKSTTDRPIIVKLSAANDFEPIVRELRGIAEAIDINSVPWRMVFGDRRSPLEHLGDGGVSGKPTQPINWALVQRLKEITDIPVIGPSVWNYEDIDRLREIGADAISFGSLFLRHPTWPTTFVRKDMATLGRS